MKEYKSYTFTVDVFLYDPVKKCTNSGEITFT